LTPISRRNVILLAGSILFYAWGAPKFIFVILGSTFVDYHLVKEMHKSTKEKKRKRLLFLSIFLNLGLLAYFKYANFFVENLNYIIEYLGFKSQAWTTVVLPIGISFYTFQTLTYSIDIYKKIHAPLEKISDYMLYILSFPQMIAGPIVRYQSIASQLVSREEKVDDKLMGFYRFSIGLAKKVLIANAMAEQADLVFESDLSLLSSNAAWIGILAYTFQIYFDFSGYSDMAIGLGRIFGFRFPENFDTPYISKSITEFWRRWHMTLGSFMKNYLYIPLGGSHVLTKRRLFFNLWIVFLLSGLWHGAAWNFIIWGAYHGLFLILDRLFLKRFLQTMGRVPSIIFTFIIVMIGWVIFRIEKTNEIKTFLYRMFSFELNDSFLTTNSFNFLIGFAFLFSFLAITKFGIKAKQFIYEKETYSIPINIIAFTTSMLLLIVSASWLISSDFNPFIYFRF
jgi:alginate O-acetyltransferase complex protein AlgI